MPHPATPSGRVAAVLVYGLIRAVDASLRYDLAPPREDLALALRQPVIFAIWHNRLALCLMLYHRYIQRSAPHRRMAAMVSASKDGGLLARVLEHFAVQPVRGSSSRRGPQALLELTSWAQRGYDLAITPDGPRGPRYVVQPGVVSLAQITGLPILPASYDLGWKLETRSWDRFQVPIPLARCTVYLGELLRIPRETTETERESLRLELERRLKGITHD